MESCFFFVAIRNGGIHESSAGSPSGSVSESGRANQISSWDVRGAGRDAATSTRQEFAHRRSFQSFHDVFNRFTVVGKQRRCSGWLGLRTSYAHTMIMITHNRTACEGSGSMGWIQFTGISFPPTWSCAKFSLAANISGSSAMSATPHTRTDHSSHPISPIVGKGWTKSHMLLTRRTYKGICKASTRTGLSNVVVSIVILGTLNAKLFPDPVPGMM